MLSTFAALVLTATEPSAAGLAAHFVQVQAALPGEQPTYETWTRPQLEAETRRLEDLKPGLGLPIALFVSGGVVVVIDLAVFLLSGFIALLSGTGLPVPLTAGIVVALIIGAGLIAMGAIFLARILSERRAIGAELELIKAALDKGSIEAVPPVPPPENTPPPAMPFPQQVRWAPTFFTVTLARF